MANSTNTYPIISASQSSKEVTANVMDLAGSPALLWGIKSLIGLELTLMEGVLNVAGTPTQIAEDSLTLTGSATNYVEATTAGVLSSNTSAFTGGRLPLYTIVMGASAYTSYTDHRSSATGAGITSGGLGTGNVVGPASAVDDRVATFDGTTGKLIQDGGVTLAQIPKLATANTFTKGQSVTPVALTDAANIAVDASLSNNFSVTLGGNRTLDNPTNLTAGQILNFCIDQDGSGSRTLAFGNLYKFPGGTNTISTGISAKDFISCYYDGTILRCNLSKAYA